MPLLILLVAFGTKEATATSLGAIVITALAGVTLYALRGKVDVAYAAARRRPGDGGSGHRHVGPETALQPGPDARVRRAPRGDRCLVADGMSTTTVVLAVGLGLGAGVTSGLFGVGGGILFVPALVALGLGQVEAAATSLLAVVPTAAVGTWRQARYGNLRVKPALVIGLASIVGVETGVQVATSLPEHVLRRLFGVLLLAVATQLAWRAARSRASYPEAR